MGCISECNTHQMLDQFIMNVNFATVQTFKVSLAEDSMYVDTGDYNHNSDGRFSKSLSVAAAFYYSDLTFTLFCVTHTHTHSRIVNKNK